MTSENFTILLISDTHFGSEESHNFNGFTPVEQFKKITRYISDNNLSYDIIIHTGNIAGDKDNHAQSANYKLASIELEKLTAGSTIPAFFLPGNHDDKELAFHCTQRFMLPGTSSLRQGHNYSFEFQGFCFIMIDSALTESRQGRLSQDALHFLSGTLKRSSLPVIICLHHPPCPVNVHWMDETMLLENQKDFTFYTNAFQEKIKAVLFGHIHFPFNKKQNGSFYSCSPSTVFQFSNQPDAPDSTINGELDSGFNLITISADELKVEPHLF